MKRKKLLQKDKKLKNWLKQGGREGSQQDFLKIIRLASRPIDKKKSKQ